MPTPLYAEVWISVRSDLVPGDGSPDNPYDASTSTTFDALMSGFGPNTIVHRKPGIYSTLGYSNTPTIGAPKWSPKPEWRLLGAGLTNTIVTLQDVPSDAQRSHKEMIGGAYDNLTDFAEISDLTAYCNLAGQRSRPFPLSKNVVLESTFLAATGSHLTI